MERASFERLQGKAQKVETGSISSGHVADLTARRSSILYVGLTVLYASNQRAPIDSKRSSRLLVSPSSSISSLSRPRRPSPHAITTVCSTARPQPYRALFTRVTALGTTFENNTSLTLRTAYHSRPRPRHREIRCGRQGSAQSQ